MKLIFVLSLICFSVSVNVKKDTSPKVNYNTMNKDCIPSEECHECSFDELKNDKNTTAFVFYLESLKNGKEFWKANNNRNMKFNVFSIY